MASQWRDATLGEVAANITVGHVGPMATEYRESGIPFLRSQNVEPYRLLLDDVKFIDNDFHQRLRNSVLSPGDIVIVRTGKPGAAAMVPRSLPVANCSDLVIVRVGRGLDPRFAMYFINTIARHHVGAHLVGAVQQHFNISSARSIKIRLPPLEEQQGISSIIGAFDDKIDLNRRMNETLEAIARAIFKSWFVDFDVERYSQGWRGGRLGEVAENPRRGIDPTDVPPSTPYIGLEHMPRKSIALDQWGHSEDLTSGKFSFFRQEILFGKLRPYFHKVGVAPVDGVCSTDILVLVPKREAYFGLLLSHVSSDEFVAYTDRSSAGTKMPRTNWADMARYEIHIPPDSVASAHTGIVRPIIEKIVSNTHESRTLADLRDTLLPKLLSGEIQVKEAEKMVGEAV